MSRKAEVLAYIVDRIVRSGVSPTLEEIRGHLNVSKTRAQELVRKLELEGRVVRRPGAQRALTVPEIEAARRQMLEEMPAEGWTVGYGPRLYHPPDPCMHVHLPMLAELEHIPDVEWPGSSGGGNEDDHR